MNIFPYGYARMVVVMTLCLSATAVSQAQTGRYSVLYRFEKDSHKGVILESMSLLAHGGALYGMTRSDGAQGKGGLFRINPDGTGFRVLHDFVGGDADGHSPCGSPILDGSTLYGLTCHGGRGKGGVVFRMNLDGSSYTVLHHFQGWVYDADTPRTSPTLDGNCFYGMTARGGTNDHGVVFRINKDGTNLTLLHTFAAGRVDGGTPNGSILLDGDQLYGVTSAGGQRNKGVLFRMNKNGSDYKILHHFVNGMADGSDPCSTLVCDDTALYGTASGGGLGDKGVVFRLNKDGTDYRILHQFPGSGADGVRPQSALTLIGSTLYGVTIGGGQNQAGVLFSISTKGKGFIVLHRFADPTSTRIQDDGAEPCGSLISDGGFLYGMTRSGGNGGGVIFRYQLPTP